MPKIVTSIILSIVLLYGCIQAVDSNYSSTFECVTLHAPDGRELNVSVEEKETYLKLGWYESPVQYIYDCYNTEYIVYSNNINELLNTGEYFLEKQNYEDVILLAKVIYAEATESPSLRILDRRYVGAVVMNRLRSGYYGKTLKEVIYADNQYACITSKKFKSQPPYECINIAYNLLSGETFEVPNNIFYQAQFKQGSGLWEKIGVHYYCYR